MNKPSLNAHLKLTPYKLSNDDLLSIGQIVRGYTEIEDIIDTHLCQMADISKSQSILLLGRSNMRSKLTMAEQLSKSKPLAHKAHKTCFNHPSFEGLIKCRNAVAHGILLGISPERNIVF